MIETFRRHRGPLTLVGLLAVATAIYWISAHKFDAGRPDLFYLADAFLHGRLWLEGAFGPYDVIVVGDRVFVPFAPFPAIALMPLVASWVPRRSLPGSRWSTPSWPRRASASAGGCSPGSASPPRARLQATAFDQAAQRHPLPSGV